MTLYGYAGKILFVDLTLRTVRCEPLDEEIVRRFVGGWGINHWLVNEVTPPEVDPLGPENAIVIGTGPFNGTFIPGASRVFVTCKRPLTGGFVTSSGGGQFSLMLKSSGYDFAVITGQSDKPVYLKIDNEDVEIIDASDIWGKTDNWETSDILRGRHGTCSVIPLGPAGENLVRYSLTFVDKGGGSLGHCGLAAVMGSKKLKAIVACRGKETVKVADPEGLQRIVDEMLASVMSYRQRPNLLKGGTYHMASQWTYDLGKITDNWTRVIEKPGFTVPEIDAIHSKVRKTIACTACPMGDKELSRITEGDYAPMTAYMTDFLFHPVHGGRDPLQEHNRGVFYDDLLNRLGIDTYNFESTYQFLVQLFREGIITKEDTGGFELNDEFETKVKVLRMTANREGIGNLAAEGALEAARQIGHDTEERVCHIKGCAPIIDPRMDTLNTMTFSQIISPGRPFYAHAGMGVYAPGRPVGEFVKHTRRMGMPEGVADRIFSETGYNTGRLTKWGEDWYSIFNCLGQCHRLYIHRFYSMRFFSELYTAVTGTETSNIELFKAGERAWNMLKVLNVKAGLGREEDQPPKVWFNALKSANGDKEYSMMDYFRTKVISPQDIEELVEDYYDERGWETATGIPRREKLQELGISDLVSEGSA